MTAPVMASPLRRGPAFDAALAGGGATLLDSDGAEADLPVQRWCSPADADDAWLLDRCTGPTVDLGCGPGRLLAGLARRGVPAMGVDHSTVAQAQCRARGTVMLRRDVFARVPGEGRWSHVLLADGNIGIGGDPARLLARAAQLLAVSGTLLVETDTAPDRDWRGWVQVHTAAGSGPPTRWARVGTVALRRLAALLGLAVVTERTGARAFVELRATVRR
jgi:SAM-dependent methyltransferase